MIAIGVIQLVLQAAQTVMLFVVLGMVSVMLYESKGKNGERRES
jgi:hypothetical protein